MFNKIQRTVLLLVTLFFILNLNSFLFANYQNDSEKKMDFLNLFNNYKNNNRDYQKLELKLEQSIISYQETCIQNGLKLSISSGRIGTEFSESGTKVNLSPEVNISSSELNNSSLNINFPIGFDVLQGDVSKSKIDNANIMFSTDIFSNVSKQKKLSLEKSNRTVLQAQRNLKKGEIKIYSSFLQDLRELYSNALSVTQSENDLIEKQLDFETVKAKGYSSSSAKYRTSFLDVERAKKTVQEKQRLYNSSLAIFALKCSVKINQIDLDFELPEVELFSINNYQKKDFEELENANWNYQINTQTRSLKSEFSLWAQGCYGFSFNDNLFSDSAEAGLNMNYKGITFSALTSIPINQNSNPKITFSLGWDPFSTKSENLSIKNNLLQDKIEKLEIEDAEEKFFDTVLQMNEKRNNLQWETEQNLEQETLYLELKEDMKLWHDKGIVSEREYRQSIINYENAKVKLALTKIDRIIYNNELSMLFVSENTEGENEN